MKNLIQMMSNNSAPLTMISSPREIYERYKFKLPMRTVEEFTKFNNLLEENAQLHADVVCNNFYF